MKIKSLSRFCVYVHHHFKRLSMQAETLSIETLTLFISPSRSKMPLYWGRLQMWETLVSVTKQEITTPNVNPLLAATFQLTPQKPGQPVWDRHDWISPCLESWWIRVCTLPMG